MGCILCMMITTKLVQNVEVIKIQVLENPFIFVMARNGIWWLGRVQRIRKKVGNGWDFQNSPLI